MHELGTLRQIVKTVVRIVEENSIQRVKHSALDAVSAGPDVSLMP